MVLKDKIMASLFGDLFNSFTGQSAVPTYNALSPQEGLTQAYGIAQGLVPQFASLNQALQPVTTGLQLANENQIYGPQANALRQGTYQSILDQLNLGESLSPELTADITRKLFESGAASGFGASDAGRGNVILQTGLEGEARGRARRAEALGATSILPASRYTYQPVGAPDPNGIYNQLQEQNQIENALSNAQEATRRQNFTNLLNTGTKLIGTAGGAIAGSMIAPGIGTVIGAQAGGQIGGSIFGAPQQTAAGQQGGFNSILQGLVLDRFMNQGRTPQNPYYPSVATPGINPYGGY